MNIVTRALSAIGFEKRSFDTYWSNFDALRTGAVTPFAVPQMAFDPADYLVEQRHYPSKDGTRIPMFLVHKKGLKLDGSAPAWLYGYGGFNVVMKPQFAVPPLVWIEDGGVYAMANLRGGGEYGEDWHQAGAMGNKEHVFEDFEAVLSWLSTSRWSNQIGRAHV